MVADWLLPYLQPDFGRWEIYGLFFLLGSFVVASLSDVKHLSAQREFLDVWFAFAVALLALDLYRAHWTITAPFALKWILIVALAIFSHAKVGGLFRLATADVAAIVAACALLSPFLVLAFFLLLKVLSYPAEGLLARGRDAYPFMPVVAVTTIGILALAAAQSAL
ncbi:MAG: hypothetical protein ACYDCK_11410 [Thermoplasmatota archaeon]